MSDTRACTDPRQPSPNDRARWVSFCLSIDERIRFARRYEGIETDRGDVWQTFDPPLEPAPPRRPVIVGPSVPMPTNVFYRDGRGRYRKVS